MPPDLLPPGVSREAYTLALQNAAEWKELFYWAVGGLAGAVVSMALIIKGFLTLRADEQKDNVKSELLQAETNRTVAEALKGLMESLRELKEATYGRKG